MAVITAKYGKKVYECSVSVSGGNEDSLIIYFSATGTTGDAASKIQEAVGADIVRLVPKTDYSSADLKYTDNSCRANKEQAENTMPAISTVIRNIDQYNTIYIGYPIWHGKEPGVIRTFLSKYSMEGKTVLPFCTSGSSGISGSMQHIRDMCLTHRTCTLPSSWMTGIGKSVSTDKRWGLPGYSAAMNFGSSGGGSAGGC